MKTNQTDLLSRRGLLRRVAVAGAGAMLGRMSTMSAFAQSQDDYRALVCIFLFGGNDANNTVVPMDTTQYNAYQSARRSLAIPQSSLLPIADVSGSYGLHPSLTGVQSVYNSGKLAIVANVGMLVQPTTKNDFQAHTAPLPTNLFSHLDQQQQWQSANPLAVSGSGWTGRLVDRMQSYNSGAQLPMGVGVSINSLQLIGQTTQPTLIRGSLQLQGSDGSDSGNARDASFQELLALPSGVAMVQASNMAMKDALDAARVISQAAVTAGPLATVFPSTPLGGQLQQIANIIQIRSALGARRQVFFCSLDGFDTHSTQAQTHAALLKTVGDAMAAFQSAMLELGVQDKVTAFTESEFGRTLQVNSSLGTDHAWGGHQMVMGGAVKGGQVYGKFPTIALGGPDDCTTRGSWVPTFSLDQYGAILAQWFGVSAADMSFVFPNLANFPPVSSSFL